MIKSDIGPYNIMPKNFDVKRGPALANARQLHEKNPQTFGAPPSRAELKLGMAVKVSNGHERFWVQLVKMTGNKFVGRIDNSLINKKYYDLGDYIELTADNIYQIYSRPKMVKRRTGKSAKSAKSSKSSKASKSSKRTKLSKKNTRRR